MVQFTAPGGRFKASATTLKFLMEWAYGIQPSQHSGGTSWMETERYDIAAKAEGNATDDQMKVMTQTLLAERFKLVSHHETKKLTAYDAEKHPWPVCALPQWQREPLRISFHPMGDQDPVSFDLVGNSAVLVEDGDEETSAASKP